MAEGLSLGAAPSRSFALLLGGVVLWEAARRHPAYLAACISGVALAAAAAIALIFYSLSTW